MSHKIFPIIAATLALLVATSGCAGTGETQPAPQPALDAASILEAAFTERCPKCRAFGPPDADALWGATPEAEPSSAKAAREAARAGPEALHVLGLGGAVLGVGGLALLLLGALGAARRERRSRREEHPRPAPSPRRARGKRAALLAAALTCGATAIGVASSWRDIEVWWKLRRDFERLADNAQGYPEYRHRQTGIVFVRLPGGPFRMGTTREELEEVVALQCEELSRMGVDGETFEWFASYVHDILHELARERPRNVKVEPFLIAKREVAYDQWEKVMGVDSLTRMRPHDGSVIAYPLPYSLRLRRFPQDVEKGQGQVPVPVRAVSWENCRQFTRRTGLSLPMESQWEYACRGGSEGPFGSTEKLDDVAWYLRMESDGAVVLDVQPVGKKQPNGFGIHDMHGNVREWCRDAVRPSEFRNLRRLLQLAGMMLPEGQGIRLTRGGTCRSAVVDCRPGRKACAFSGGDRCTGFRPVYELAP